MNGEGGRDHGSHGVFDNKAHATRAELRVSHHTRTMTGFAGAVGVAEVLTGKVLVRR